jgi:hypothetical protein
LLGERPLFFKVSRILSACPLVMNIDSREKFRTLSILCKCSTPRGEERGMEERWRAREECREGVRNGEQER